MIMSMSMSMKYEHGATTTRLVNDKVQIARGDCLAVEQAALVGANMADATARLLEDHHLLHDLLLIAVQEVCELLGAEARVELQEAAQCRHGLLCGDVREEEVQVAQCWVGGVRLGRDELSERGGVVVRRWVGGDELGTGVGE